jgi:hypothetical protein
MLVWGIFEPETVSIAILIAIYGIPMMVFADRVVRDTDTHPKDGDA